MIDQNTSARIALLLVICIAAVVLAWAVLQVYRYFKAVKSMQEPKCHDKETP